MAFNTIEEANAYELKMEKEHNDLKTSYEGLKTKLTDTEKLLTDGNIEIERLKAKNYELYEQVSVSNKTDNNTSNEDDTKKDETSLDDVINNFI